MNYLEWIYTLNRAGLSQSVYPRDTSWMAGVRFPMRSLDFSMDPILPAALWPMGSTQRLTEMSTRNLPGGKGRPAREADNLTAICEPIF
jgi:hypothetical protein